MLTSLEHVQIPVQQMDRAISWYTEQLGFRLSSRDGDRIAFLTLPEGPLLMLWQTNDDLTNAHYHSWLHQFSLVKRCPIHQIDLADSCPRCFKKIPFMLSDKGLSDAFTCICGYKLADFTLIHWSEWNYPVNTRDDSVNKWFDGVRMRKPNRILFFPQSTSIEMISLAPTITSRFDGAKQQETKREYYSSQNFKDEIYNENKQCYKTIDRYIKKKFLKNHHVCILTLQELWMKENGGGYPPICPYAYAYVFWKHTLLRTDHFYDVRRGDEANPRKYLGTEFATQLFERYLIDYINKLFNHTNLYDVDNRKMFHWIINRITTEMCLNFFYQWLVIKIMIERSLPKTVFKHHADVSFMI
ncbi:VOC family protein [Paenibacillus sp. H1-7]|uniref:VOC family protein n=1 Tax=Paenibacillus sp. H1-7 TaxID=2282849 RepID=UPI001EF92D25|nr:VOC family protein [Paenibacillus sp. H1-7]ULL16366.1 VOC family protein [Paenibacillus sp. H1-7]